ncbi:MAG: glucose-6-phosphate isomerase, partial [Oscillospiraceae bacterium]
MAVKINSAYLDGFVSKSDFEAVAGNLKTACLQLADGTGKGNDYIGWRDLPSDYNTDEFTRIKAAAQKIRSDSDVLVVIGIGGSYLGARAVIEMLGSQFFNEFSPLKIYFAGNNISGDYINHLVKLCEGKRLSVNIVSKSGTTTEPALAFRIFKK